MLVALLAAAGLVGPPSPAAAPTLAHGRTLTVLRCQAGQLRARVQTFGSEMSQPFMDIALENVGPAPCAVGGYILLRAWGSHSGDEARRLDISVDRGDFYERDDPGPGRIVLRAGQRALLSIGTATAYQGGAHIFVIERLAICVRRAGAPLTLTGLGLPASAPPRAAIPVGVTALYAGRPRPPN
jgi:hypothetical protein